MSRLPHFQAELLQLGHQFLFRVPYVVSYRSSDHAIAFCPRNFTLSRMLLVARGSCWRRCRSRSWECVKGQHPILPSITSRTEIDDQ